MSKSLFAMYEPEQRGFRRLEASRFRKDVIRSGKWRLADGRVLAATPARMDHWIEQFNAMRAAGLKVHAPIDHSGRSDDNLGWVEALSREGDTLYAVFDFPEHESRIGSTIREVSVAVDPKLTDGTGKVWEDVIYHISPCTEPVVTGQENFERLAARSEAAGERLYLSRKERPRMGLIEQVRKQLGVDETVGEDDLAKRLGEKIETHTETLRRAKSERDNALEAGRKSKEAADALQARVKALERDGKPATPPDETEREKEYRLRLERIEDERADDEVAAAIRSGKLVDKVKEDAAALLRDGQLRLSRKGEAEKTAQQAFRNVLASLPEGASLDLAERAKRTVELRNPNGGGEKSEEERLKAGKARAERIQPKSKDT